MRRANGRDYQNSYQFQPRQRDSPGQVGREVKGAGTIPQDEGGGEREQKATTPEIDQQESTATSSQVSPETPKTGPDNLKKKKKKPSKDERRRRREDAALRELYKPKDSRISVVAPELFQKIKGAAAANSSFGGALNFSTSNSTADFPSLGTPPSASTLSFKTFASAASPQFPPTIVAVEEETPKTSTPTAFIPSSSSTPGSSASAEKKNQKLSKLPIVFNIEDALVQTSPNSIKPKDAVAQTPKDSKFDRLSAIRANPKITAGNPLDSSGPVVIHRGKIKEKKKKHTALKKSILKSREDRRKKSGSLQPQLPFSAYPEEESAIAPDVDVDVTLNSSEESGVEQIEVGLQKLDLSNNGTDTDGAEIAIEVIPEVNSSRAEVPLALCDGKDIETEEELPIQKEEAELLKELLEKAEENVKPPPVIPENIIQQVKLQLHTRKFRPYCDMFVRKELHGLVIRMMSELHRLQDRIYKTDPMKLLTKRRFIHGIREVLGSLKLRRRVQLVIIAPDIEPSTGDGGLDEKISEIISLARENKVPYLFSGNRFILGRCIKQTKSPVSVMAILDKQSVEEQFQKVLLEVDLLRSKYNEEFNRRVQEIMGIQK